MIQVIIISAGSDSRVRHIGITATHKRPITVRIDWILIATDSYCLNHCKTPPSWIDFPDTGQRRSG